MKIEINIPEWQYKEIKGTNGISEGVMINALCAIRLGKPIEQKPVLDKIRAEIEELDYITFDGITKKRCLEIIDKYKAETEADNGND